MSDRMNGHTSRRRVLAGGAAVLAAGVGARAALAQQKLSQKVAQYQDKPRGNQKCSACVNFVAPNTCKVVEGTISPDGWCIAFAPKA